MNLFVMNLKNKTLFCMKIFIATLLSLFLLPYTSAADTLPQNVVLALEKAAIPTNHISVMVLPINGNAALIDHNAKQPVTPASTMKLVTTLAALEELGPNFRWKTQILTNGTLKNDVLQGDLVIRGGGDPNLTWEKFALMLRSLRDQGIKKIAGNILLDRSYFQPPRSDLDSAPFDEYPHAYYNVIPDALLIHSNIFAFELDSSSGQMNVRTTPPLANVNIQNQLRLDNRPCANWEKTWNEPRVVQGKNHSINIVLSGTFPRACKTATYLNILDRNLYIEHLIGAIWSEMGGTWSGEILNGSTPNDARLLVERPSDTLADTVKIVNKFSDNSMARILYLTLGAESNDPNKAADHLQAANTRILKWLQQHQINTDGIQIDNGSGLSRTEQISPQQLAAVLVVGANSTWAPEYLSSLPIAALDGSMRRRLKGNIAEGQARIKTGTLNNVVAIAGYVRDVHQQLWVTVAVINHENASKGRPALDELISWVAAGHPQ